MSPSPPRLDDSWHHCRLLELSRGMRNVLIEGTTKQGRLTEGKQQAGPAFPRARPSLYVAQVLHLAPVPLLRHLALVLLALQVLPELHLFTGSDVTH